MDITIVVPCYNGAETLAETLEAIARQKYDKEWEIVFSDNGSTDDSRRIAESFIDKVPMLRIVDSSAERGQPFALDNGIDNARGENILLCDADDVPFNGWLAAMGKALTEHSIVACSTDTELLNPAWTKAVRGNFQGRGLQKVSYPPYMHHAGGGTLGFKKTLHKELGGFDPELPCLHDTDFCFKAQIAGHQIYFVEKAVISIRFRPSYSSIFRQSKVYGEYNILLSKKYRLTGEAPTRRWKRFYQEIKKIIQFYFKKGKDNKDYSLFYSRLGWTMGRMKGVFKYRFPPF
jgi:glycosyltransferase involved in cell wall biosynthesis